MIRRNTGFANLTAGYLFPEVARRSREYAASHPDAKIISLSVGNTTEPLTPHISKAMADYASSLATPEGYSGYGDEQGLSALREKVAGTFYAGMAEADEVFISDGAKCDIARIQTLFGRKARVAVQDPAYPVYVDGSVLIGAAGACRNGQYKGITYMPCTPENNFLPDFSKVRKNSLIYFCSPNNPTGYTSTKEELQQLVDFARTNGCIIVFDAAYAQFIRTPGLPMTIFEIPGARDCAIEINSFSKPAGFTGVRLGWSVVPGTLAFADGTPVIKDWSRVMTTLFNGASNIAQHGGLAALDPEGLVEMKNIIDYYLENVKMIHDALAGDNFRKAGVQVYSTGNSPYLWVRFPGYKSWDIFDRILDKCRVVTTPGSGFGASGESFLRFSSFGHHEAVTEACGRLSLLQL
ncbi:MAG TPA: LL-diaminopimelate aminotransferase [Treponema sp.]|nr:LL-diaminopimelate aminotransferase [Treponema sp.]